jgi:hypothetical protein
MVCWRSNPRDFALFHSSTFPNSGASLGIFIHTCPKSGAKTISVGAMMLCYSPVARLFDGLILLALCSRRSPLRERITSTIRRNGAPRRYGSLRR